MHTNWFGIQSTRKFKSTNMTKKLNAENILSQLSIKDSVSVHENLPGIKRQVEFHTADNIVCKSEELAITEEFLANMR